MIAPWWVRLRALDGTEPVMLVTAESESRAIEIAVECAARFARIALADNGHTASRTRLERRPADYGSNSGD